MIQWYTIQPYIEFIWMRAHLLSRILAMLATVLVVLSANIAPRHAALAAESSVPVDVMFLLDQSDSVVGSSDVIDPTDPNGLAIEAVQRSYDSLLARVFEQRLTPTDQQVEQEIRFGLVRFGRTVNSSERLVPITISSVEGQIRAAYPPSLPNQPESFGDATRFSLAFEQACWLFGGGKTCDTPLDPNRRRIMILLSDGDPRPGQDSTDYPVPADLLERQHNNPTLYYNELRQRFARLFDDPRTDLWTFAIDNGQNSGAWAENQQYWSELSGGRVKQLIQAEDSTEAFQATLDTVFPTTQATKIIDCSANNTFVVPPYTASLAMLVTYQQADSDVSIAPVASTALARDATQENRVVYEGREAYSEFLLVQRPAAGAWQCSIVGEAPTIMPKLRLRIGSALLAAAYLVPDAPTPPEGACSTSLRYTLAYTGTDGLPLQERNDAPIVPGLANDDPRISINNTQQLVVIPADEGGSVTVAITATVEGSTPIRLPSFKTPAYAAADQPCAIEWIGPTAGSPITLTNMYRPLPLDLTARVVDRNKRPLVGKHGRPVVQVQPPSGKPIEVLMEQRGDTWRVPEGMLNQPGTYRVGATIAANGREVTAQPLQFRRVYDPRRRALDSVVWLVAIGGLLIAAFLFERYYRRLRQQLVGTLIVRMKRPNSTTHWRIALAELQPGWLNNGTFYTVRSKRLPQLLYARYLQITPISSDLGEGVRVLVMQRDRSKQTVELRPGDTPIVLGSGWSLEFVYRHDRPTYW